MHYLLHSLASPGRDKKTGWHNATTRATNSSAHTAHSSQPLTSFIHSQILSNTNNWSAKFRYCPPC